MNLGMADRQQNSAGVCEGQLTCHLDGAAGALYTRPWSHWKPDIENCTIWQTSNLQITYQRRKKKGLWVEAQDFTSLHMPVVGLMSTFHCQRICTEWESIYLEVVEIWLGYEKLLWMKNKAWKMRLGQINWDRWYDERWQEMSRAWLSSGARFLDPHLCCPTDGSITCLRRVIPYINCGWTECPLQWREVVPRSPGMSEFEFPWWVCRLD